MGATEKIPIMISAWTPIVGLFLINLIMLLNINEKIISNFSLFHFLITVIKNVHANEPFEFNITEIEILQNGNQINGYKGGTAVSEDAKN